MDPLDVSELQHKILFAGSPIATLGIAMFKFALQQSRGQLTFT